MAAKVKTKFELVASNTAVMETLTMSGMEQMLTLYGRQRSLAVK